MKKLKKYWQIRKSRTGLYTVYLATPLIGYLLVIDMIVREKFLY